MRCSLGGNTSFRINQHQHPSKRNLKGLDGKHRHISFLIMWLIIFKAFRVWQKLTTLVIYNNFVPQSKAKNDKRDIFLWQL